MPLHFRYLSFLAIGLALMPSAPEAIPSFPGAEGYGSQATGGRGGEVYIVTHLEDSGPGSLREGLENARNPRTIVFEVAGTIQLQSNLRVRDKRNLTIAGQTAPGDGILLRGATLQFEDCQNLIVRHLRVRYGWDTGEEGDAVWLRNTTNAIFDHLSVSWGMDECFSLTKETTQVTVQYCLIAEGVKAGHQYGMLIDSETEGGGRISLIGNLFSNHLGRMPRCGSGTDQEIVLDAVNNILYNWGSEGDWGTQGTALNPASRSNWNFVNNYSIAGRNTRNGNYRTTILRGGEGTDRFYISGNKCDGNVDGALNGVEAGWDYVDGNYVQRTAPFSIPSWASVKLPLIADEALLSAIDTAGAYPLRRDSVDRRLVEELSSYGTSGLVVTRLWYPHWPILEGGQAALDSDRDGMPDEWEEDRGLDPGDPSDGPELAGEQGYTHLEDYLNWLVRPTVSLSVDRLSVNEGVTAQVRLRRRGYTNETLAVPLLLTGDASPEVDYTSPGEQALFGPGYLETTIPIHALLDNHREEGTETVQIRLLESPDEFRLGDIDVTHVDIGDVTPPASIWLLK